MSSVGRTSQVCEQCGRSFRSETPAARYCSEECREKANKEQEKEQDDIEEKLNEWRQGAMGKLLSLRYKEQNLEQEQEKLKEEGKMLCPICRGKGKYAGETCESCEGEGYWLQ